ncbi:hypothetical protein HNY73_022885 [Argiope bruennichi]|uniref:DUF7041 domain-containing protein n=1 Tax=Argiope bruennichi TaxID=94029 RepID=A0A8T0E3T6_ARGBR|nr:hypothetical protein HNY73_022885 [Argiope bruennichi]
MMEEISAVKMPNFIPSDPSLWFTMVESTFELAIPKPITASRTKSQLLREHLPPEIAITVRDIILSPDATDPYSQLKSEIISRCGESKSQEIQLPSNVQSILASIQPLTPQKASEIADKILDITPNQAAHILSPLIKFLEGHTNKKKSPRPAKKSETTLQWSEEADKAFSNAKKALAESYPTQTSDSWSSFKSVD